MEIVEINHSDLVRVAFWDAVSDFDPSALFETSVADALATEQGKGHPLPKAFIDFFEKLGSFDAMYFYSTYPFKKDGEYVDIETPIYEREYIPQTYEDLIRPMIVGLEWMDKNGCEKIHSLDDVYIENIDIAVHQDELVFGCKMELGS